MFQGTFSLIVEAWHDTNETSRSDGELFPFQYHYDKKGHENLQTLVKFISRRSRLTHIQVSL